MLLFGALQLACSEPAGTASEGTGGSQQGQGAASGTGGSKTSLDQTCDAALNGVGGAIYLEECRGWLDQTPNALGEVRAPLAVTCLDGVALGSEDPSGAKPALRVACEADSNPDLNGAHNVYHCVAPLLDNPCAEGHEDAVRDCLSQPYPCKPSLAEMGCDSIVGECPDLEPSVCFWAMSAGDRSAIVSCLETEQQGETCEDRFMRCAWGL